MYYAQGASEMILLTSNRKGQLYSSLQIEDYLYRGAELEKSSFSAFVINTWEEPFSSTREHSSSGQTNRKGRPQHEHSHYLPEHPKSESCHRCQDAVGAKKNKILTCHWSWWWPSSSSWLLEMGVWSLRCEICS